MKQILSIVFSVQLAVLLVALMFLFYTPLPAELLLLDQQLIVLGGGQSGLLEHSEWRQLAWYPLLEISPWILSLAMVLFVLPRIRTITACLISLLLIISLVAVQLGVHMRLQLSFPLGLLIQYIMISSPIVMLWAFRSKAWQHIIAERDEAFMELCSYKLRQGQLEQASGFLRRCNSSVALAPLAYELAVQYEQKRAYSEAKETYQWLASFAPKYKDVAVKVGGPKDKLPAPAIDAMAVTQTLAMGAANQALPVLGRYHIQKELGRGAMGVVYLGEDPKISRLVAIKTLNYKAFEESELEEVKERFFREAQAAGRLTHPNIVTIFDVGEEPDLSFIAMDYIAGETLREHIDSAKLLDIATAYRLVADVADALAYAHRLNIVHRDIKPGNLLYNPNDQQVKVADFGIARIVDNSRTKTGSIIGSPMYMSPEQLKGHKATPASDIYSLGATFYQLLTGQPAYTGESIADLAYKVVNKKYKSVRELRPELPASATRIINKAMAKEAGKRFENAAAMTVALRNALAKDFGMRA